MGKLKEIVFDCRRAAPLARFWAALLEDYAVRPYDDEEIARLAGLGLTPETDPSVMVDGPGPAICVHLRPGPRPWRNRVHLDISSTDRPAEVARLLALGASWMREGSGYTVLRDPEGNQFCVVDAD